MGAAIDITGETFGRLKALHATDKRKNKKVVWHCQCQCGNTVDVSTNLLRNGYTKSCGCLRIETTGNKNKTHGASVGFQKTSLYRVWIGIKSRCSNPKHPKYAYYGGRGIKVCKKWVESFEDFRDHVLALPNCPIDAGTTYQATLTLDRKNNDKHYAPGNIQWATRKQQAQNRRSNIIVSINNTKMTLQQAVDSHSDLSYNTVRMRLQAGWKVKDALSKPLHTRKSNV